MKQLIRIQNGLNGNLNKAYSNYNKIEDSKKTSSYLSERIKQIQEIWESFKKVHTEIITADDEDEENVAVMKEYERLELYENFESTYFEFLGELNEMLKKKA